MCEAKKWNFRLWYGYSHAWRLVQNPMSQAPNSCKNSSLQPQWNEIRQLKSTAISVGFNSLFLHNSRRIHMVMKPLRNRLICGWNTPIVTFRKLQRRGNFPNSVHRTPRSNELYRLLYSKNSVRPSPTHYNCQFITKFELTRISD